MKGAGFKQEVDFQCQLVVESWLLTVLCSDCIINTTHLCEISTQACDFNFLS